ncbi:MAG TPA: prepilin-type N-terminal cleavage/methylation domain-containing protein [Alphaproteobacteria bacterium]
MTSTRPDAAAGFSLLEMIVALAVLGLLTVLLAGSLQFGARLWDAQDRRLAASAGTDAVHSVLRAMIQNAQPLPLVALGPRGAASYMLGGRDSLDLVTEMPEGVGRAGYCDVALVLERDGRLALRWRRHARDPRLAAAEPVAESELLRNVAAVELSYFMHATDQQPAHWQDRWTQPSAMPDLIRVRVRFRPGDRRVWHDVVVSPAIGASGS